MFDPKITEGEWGVDITTQDTLWIGTLRIDGKVWHHVCTVDSDRGYKKEIIEQSLINAKAIAALPELLEVLKRVYELKDSCIVVAKGDSYAELDALNDAVEKLEERHCDE